MKSTEKPHDAVTEILRQAKVIAVVGLSSRRQRPSYGVSEYMQRAGYRIIPVNPNETEVLGEKSYPRLEDFPGAVDIVDIFRRPEFVPEIATQVFLDTQARALESWLNYPDGSQRWPGRVMRTRLIRGRNATANPTPSHWQQEIQLGRRDYAGKGTVARNWMRQSVTLDNECN